MTDENAEHAFPTLHLGQDGPIQPFLALGTVAQLHSSRKPPAGALIDEMNLPRRSRVCLRAPPCSIFAAYANHVGSRRTAGGAVFFCVDGGREASTASRTFASARALSSTSSSLAEPSRLIRLGWASTTVQ
jgi:hypothetical protein